MQEEGDITQDSGNPHETKHPDTNIGTDVQLVLRCEGNFRRDADYGGNDGGNADDDGGNSGEDAQRQAPPPRAKSEGSSEEEDGVEDGASHEEAVHDLRANLQHAEDSDDLGRESDFGAGEEFADEDFYGVEPVECFRFRAMGDSPRGCILVSPCWPAHSASFS